jgi:hypothetical protein
MWFVGDELVVELLPEVGGHHARTERVDRELVLRRRPGARLRETDDRELACRVATNSRLAAAAR